VYGKNITKAVAAPVAGFSWGRVNCPFGFSDLPLLIGTAGQW